MVRIKYQGTTQGQPFVNLFYGKYTSLNGVDMHALAVALGTLWSTTWATACTANTLINATSVWDLASAAGIVGTDTTQHTGTRTVGVGSQLPVNVACAVSWIVAYRWRGGHFRTYFPGSYDLDTSGGKNFTDTYAQLVKTAAGNFRTAMKQMSVPTGGLELSGVRYYGSGGSETNPPTPLGVPIPLKIEAEAVRHRIDSMRRRLGKEIS
jgi:hypothetical protein